MATAGNMMSRPGRWWSSMLGKHSVRVAACPVSDTLWTVHRLWMWSADVRSVEAVGEHKSAKPAHDDTFSRCGRSARLQKLVGKGGTVLAEKKDRNMPRRRQDDCADFRARAHVGVDHTI